MVGAAGAAGAAELPQSPDLGGLTSVEGSGLGKTVEGAATPAADTAGKAGGKVVGTTLPVASKTLTETGSKAAPVAKKATPAAKSAGKKAKGGLPTDSLGGLPTQGLPTQGLPLG